MPETSTQLTPSATGRVITICWPVRACCCPAWPMVAVLMPPTQPRGPLIDLFLCAHHYRASLGPLAIIGAIVCFREHLSTVALVR